MLKPTIAIGQDKEGKLSLLYLGRDAQTAVDIVRNLPPGIVEAEVYRKPRHFKRVRNEAVPEVVLVEDSGPEIDPEILDVPRTPEEEAASLPEPAPVERPRRGRR